MNDLADGIYEQILVIRCQTGDGAAFGEIVERYSGRLRYYVRTFLGNERAADSEDVLQEVWLDVHRSIPTLADPGALAAWLYRVARNRTIRQIRKRRPATRPLEDADAADAVESDAEFSAEDAEAIHAGLALLAPEHREVLVLRFLEAMDYEGIASVTGCPVGTVRSRLHYAKLALRREMERQDHDAAESRQGPARPRSGRPLRRP